MQVSVFDFLDNFVPFIQYVKQILTTFYSGHSLKNYRPSVMSKP